jgi:ankyrin repeat protein
MPLIEKHATAFPLLTTLMPSGSAQLVRNRETGKIHKHLGLFMPESMADQHVMRAESVCHQGSHWANLTWLEMALFFSSNNLHFPLPGAFPGGNMHTDDAILKASDKMLLELFRLLETSGAALQMVIAVQAPTAQSLLDRLFAGAVRAGSVDTLRKLIEMDPISMKPRIQAPIRDLAVHGDEMVAPVDFALRAGNFAMVDFLLEHGATLTGTASGRGSPLRFLLDSHLAVTSKTDVHARSRLNSAITKIIQAQRESYSETELLRHLDRMRWSAKNKGGWANAPGMILDCLGKMEAQSTSPFGGLQNPLRTLIHAIHYGNSDLIIKLVPRVPNLDAVWGGFGQYLLASPMTEAAWAKDLDTCGLLLRHGASADPTSIPAQHPSALQIAAHEGSILMATLLLDKGANINHSFNDVALHSESTALGAAIATGQRDMVRLLLHHNAEPTLSDLVGLAELEAPLPGLEGMLQQTASNQGERFMGAALLIAVRRGSVDVAKLLVRSGASWTYESEAKETPIALALALGHVSLVEHISNVNSQSAFVLPCSTVRLLLDIDQPACLHLRSRKSVGGSAWQLFRGIPTIRRPGWKHRRCHLKRLGSVWEERTWQLQFAL